jgi:hypothetical protein
MLSKCANSTCSAKFRRLGEGKVFAVEHRSSSYARQSDPGSEFEQIHRELRCFWLCRDCSQFMTVQASGGGGVRLAPARNVFQSNDHPGDLVPDWTTKRGCYMEHSKRKLNVLMRELEFLESGGYRLQMGWRSARFFEDSPTCAKLPHSACPNVQCAFLDFVPRGRRAEVVPCRHIPLNEAGETVQSLYNTTAADEIENAVREWLEDRIEELKQYVDSGSAAAKGCAA